jgi:orotidine-5'-phosphate decarboxylase
VLDLDGMGGPVLAPGLGAQGGRPEDLRRIFGSATGRVLAAYSREILEHGPSVTDLRAAADRVLADLRHNL